MVWHPMSGYHANCVRRCSPRLSNCGDTCAATTKWSCTNATSAQNGSRTMAHWSITWTDTMASSRTSVRIAPRVSINRAPSRSTYERTTVKRVCIRIPRGSWILSINKSFGFVSSAYLCSECGKSFNNRSNLRQHLIRHSGQKPYSCNQCPSRFSCRAGLRSHLSCHSGLRPHVCDTCGSAFTKASSLVKHNRIHSGDRPYPCEMCDMRFTCSDHLKRHKRTHTGEKREPNFRGGRGFGLN